MSCLTVTLVLFLSTATATAGQSNSKALKNWYQHTGRLVARKFVAGLDVFTNKKENTSVKDVTGACVSLTRESLNATYSQKQPPIASLAVAYRSDLAAADRAFSQCTTDLDSGDTQGVSPAIENGASALEALFKIVANARNGKGTVPSTPTTTTMPPTTTTTTSPVLFTQTGTGTQSTSTFNAPTNWNLAYTYNCANFGSGQGIFQVYVMPDSLLLLPVNQLGASGSGTEHYHSGGSGIYLEVNSECSWTITATR